MLLPVSFLNKVIMNELVVLPLEVSGANFLDPPSQVSFKGVVRPTEPNYPYFTPCLPQL